MPPEDDDLVVLGACELASILGIATDTLYKRRSIYPETLPPAIKNGRRLRWFKRDVMAWMRLQTEERP
ncbi:transcriptional regulator, AlpA family [Methylomagnum ishizawai]|uniref:Transcriptional regulator, AlpA family n=1 Tax=Methylomagnum ishizawai TaxID=1760988 RepID=A0A1Y6D2Q9_9GAMM|nr:transcriptional regulator, AlpA family [Methylomagnum ishizawai]